MTCLSSSSQHIAAPAIAPRGAYQRLREEAPDELASARVRDALEGIEGHASEVCDVDFAG